jgi:hypothetical protein
LYSSADITGTIQLRKIWAGNATPTREMRNAYKISVGKPEGKNHLGDVDVDKDGY